MAKPYLEKLNKLVTALALNSEFKQTLTTRHFFSGAALYIGNHLCASWSPGGLAFKLENADELINSGMAQPLKYFAKGHIKKGYAAFAVSEPLNVNDWRSYFMQCLQQH